MTVAPPIHSSALMPIEFVPDAQDAEKFKRLRMEDITERRQAAERAQKEVSRLHYAGEIDQVEAGTRYEAIDIQFEQLLAEQDMVDTEYRRIKARYPVPQVFLIIVPTSIEREQINSRLITLGLKQITQEMIRATMIEELYHQDWSLPGEEISHEVNQQRAEDNANFLDSVWLRQQAHDEATRRWSEQEIERTLDTKAGAPERERAPAPPKIIGVREQAKMQLLLDRMMTESQRLRELAAANMDFGRRNAILLVRMHLAGVEGFTPKIPLERGRTTRALTEDMVLALREQIDDVSWNQLVGYIDRLYQIDGGEEKNSDSQRGKLPPPDGSTEPSESPASSGGSSTISSSTPAPVDASETITDKSSASTSDSSTEAGSTAEKPSLTVVD